MSRSTPLLLGTLDLLILKALSLEPLHGLGVSRRIEQMTNGAYTVGPGSLFPALHRLEENGWLAGSEGESENRRKAKFYRLTAAGRRQLAAETDEWNRVVGVMRGALKSS
jgi:transcriptional regulator